MSYFIVLKKRNLYLLAAVILFIGSALFIKTTSVFSNIIDEDAVKIVEDIFKTRSQAILTNDYEKIKSFYDEDSKYSTWAYEQEEKKVRYINNWSEKQGVIFTEITPQIKIRSMKKNGTSISLYLTCSTEYKYCYENDRKAINSFRIGTYHTFTMTQREDQWIITKEWYTDPFADSLNLDNIKYLDAKEYITSQAARDFSNLTERRVATLDYIKKYCGAASEPQYNFSYNKKYRDYNPQGGDCANFASQALFEGGKFKKTSSWNYDKSGATKAWLNAQGFSDYLLYSGRGALIKKGTYDQIYKSAYKLIPGDIVAYEKDGKITHVSVVSGADSKGYTLVSCHNTDRNNVPWDLGWSNKNIKFWFIHLNY